MEVKWYHRKWFVVLMMLAFWPVGLALLWTSPETKLVGRVIWSGVAGLILIIWIGMAGSPPTAPVTAPTTAAVSNPVSDPATADAGSELSAEPEPAPKPEPTWQVTNQWSGSGMKSTETFEVTGREFRISWSAWNEQFFGTLQVLVYREDGNLVNLVANHMGEGSDTTYVRVRPGRYYLTINSANIDWSIQVEQLH